MSPSTNTRSVPTPPTETIDIVPPIPPITDYITRSDLYDTIKHIHTNMKSYIEKNYINMKSMNDHIDSMLATPIGTSVKTNNQK